MAPREQTLFENKWVSLRQTSDPEAGIPPYVYSHESRCDGQIIAVLPYRYLAGGAVLQFLLHVEKTPAWGWEPHPAAITGGVEPGFHREPREDAAREIREETGYEVEEQQLISLGTCRGAKSCDSTYHLFTVDLTGQGDGCMRNLLPDGELEKQEYPVWMDRASLGWVIDPLVSVMALRWLYKVNSRDGLPLIPVIPSSTQLVGS